jgi:hypothetical protein
VTENNPILRIEFSEQDYRDPATAGGPPREIVPVTPQLRTLLKQNLEVVETTLAPKFERFLDVSPVMVMQLRENAIAKSHRPLSLINEAELTLVGNGRLGELMLSVAPPNFDALKYVIAERDTQVLKANISTIEGFHAWGPQQALSGELTDPRSRERVVGWMNAGKPLIVELFLQPTARRQEIAEQDFLQFIAQYKRLRIEGRAPGLVGRSFCVWAATPELAWAIAEHPAVRQILPAPAVLPVIGLAPMAEDHGPLPAGLVPTVDPGDDLPVVGIFDTGVAPGSKALTPWLSGREVFVLPPETDYLHGTMVASMVAVARPMNGNDPRLPAHGAKVLDVAGMEISNADANDLVDRLRDVLKKHPEVKVWNLSLGTILPAPEHEFGWFAQQIDRLADDFGVLFVVAAGNTPVGYLHTWPPGAEYPEHRISSPADSVRALSVGSLAHQHTPDTLVTSEAPSPFTRRGPGPVRTPKPDVVHYGGNCDLAGFTCGAGMRTVIPGDHLGITLGTSFAAPQVAAQAAQLWKALTGRGMTPTPELVKGLLIHAAAVRSPERSADDRRYFGAGVPGDMLDTLFCDDGAFTLLFEVDVADRKKWTKTPFPIPECLRPAPGRFKGEILLTLVYSPPLDASQGAEYVRANVDVSFGTLTYKDGSPQVKGLVPMEKSGPAGSLYESAQVEYGYKWSPVKTYRERFARGVAAEQWALQASITRRSLEPVPARKQKAVILVTLRALEDGRPVYADGIKALAATNWIHRPIAQRVVLSSRPA